MTINQKQLIFELFNDNLRIFNEIINVENGILCKDEEFVSKSKSIIEYCKTLYFDCVSNSIDLATACFVIKNLINEIYNECENYSRYSYGYKIMNSFFDKTLETYNEFINK